jgi:hypothetical protein
MSQQIPLFFDVGTPVFSQLCDITANESHITNEDGDPQEDEINNEEAPPSKMSGDSLGRGSNALTGMSVTSTHFENKSDVPAESLLTSLKGSD